MIDEKYRHEIAEAMRRCNPKAFRWPIGLAAAIAQASDGGQDPIHELADLIDRPTCEVKEDNCWASDFDYVCRSCGEHFSTCDKPNYCPGCGARVVRDDAQ